MIYRERIAYAKKMFKCCQWLLVVKALNIVHRHATLNWKKLIYQLNMAKSQLTGGRPVGCSQAWLRSWTTVCQVSVQSGTSIGNPQILSPTRPTVVQSRSGLTHLIHVDFDSPIQTSASFPENNVQRLSVLKWTIELLKVSIRICYRVISANSLPCCFLNNILGVSFASPVNRLSRKQVVCTKINQICYGSQQETKGLRVSWNALQPFLEISFEGWRVHISKNGSNFLASTLCHDRCGGKLAFCFTWRTSLSAWLCTGACKQSSIFRLHFFCELRFWCNLRSYHGLYNLQLSTKFGWFDIVCAPTLNEVFCWFECIDYY